MYTTNIKNLDPIQEFYGCVEEYLMSFEPFEIEEKEPYSEVKIPEQSEFVLTLGAVFGLVGTFFDMTTLFIPKFVHFGIFLIIHRPFHFQNEGPISTHYDLFKDYEWGFARLFSKTGESIATFFEYIFQGMTKDKLTQKIEKIDPEIHIKPIEDKKEFNLRFLKKLNDPKVKMLEEFEKDPEASFDLPRYQ